MEIDCDCGPEKAKREETFLEKENIFRTRAFIIIEKMVNWCADPRARLLVDEVLHSIFFLGKINNPSFSPQEIISDTELFQYFEDTFPQPFKVYSYQLPKRGPFSCVLDMIVHLKGEQNEEVIKENLRAFKNNPRLGKGKHLLSSTVCVSHTQNGKRYYGVSMSANGKKPVKIIIAASCLSYWDNDVAGAVMTYYPDKTKNKSFDGTITLPPYVSCQAFTISTGDRKDPCKSCKDLFGLSSEENKEWSYGNCAEAESLSNLFKNEPTVKEQLQRKSVRDKDRKNAEESVTVHLLKLLGKPEFYTPPMPVQKKT